MMASPALFLGPWAVPLASAAEREALACAGLCWSLPAVILSAPLMILYCAWPGRAGAALPAPEVHGRC